MFISQAVGYALHGLTSLSSAQGERMYAADIARSIGASESYLAKTFQSLAHAGLVTSVRGMKGGYTLARPTDEISVREVIEAIEGPFPFPRPCCVFRTQTDRDCPDCPVMVVMERAYEQVLEELDAMTIEELAESVLRWRAPRPEGEAAPAPALVVGPTDSPNLE